MKNHHNKKRYIPGFTLMEVMVSVTIFTIIITIGIGSLLTIFNTLQKSRADRETMDSLSFVMDTMTRRIRTGSAYQYYQGLPSGITFKDQAGIPVNIFEEVDPNSLSQRLYIQEGTDQPFDITPPNLHIDNFSITLTGQSPGSADGQPMAKINLSGTVTNGKQSSPLSIQAAVSQRFLDF